MEIPHNELFDDSFGPIEPIAGISIVELSSQDLITIPLVSYNPESFGLEVQARKSDEWLVDESRGDLVLLALLLAKERVGAQHAKHEVDDEVVYLGLMSKLGAAITARQDHLTEQSDTDHPPSP